ncbi:MAG TPA: hypothetical protein PK891_01265 [Bacteroidales bacterium]|nr:hypothetical protein [Bacteroidales bacterium]
MSIALIFTQTEKILIAFSISSSDSPLDLAILIIVLNMFFKSSKVYSESSFSGIARFSFVKLVELGT